MDSSPTVVVHKGKHPKSEIKILHMYCTLAPSRTQGHEGHARCHDADSDLRLRGILVCSFAAFFCLFFARNASSFPWACKVIPRKKGSNARAQRNNSSCIARTVQYNASTHCNGHGAKYLSCHCCPKRTLACCKSATRLICTVLMIYTRY